MALVLTWAVPASSAWAITPPSRAAQTITAETRAEDDTDVWGNGAGAGAGVFDGTAAGNDEGARSVEESETLEAAPAAVQETAGCAISVFPAERFTRTTGPATVYDRTFTVPAWVVSPFGLRVQNGEPGGSNRVSSAEVFVNNVRVLQQSDFNQNVHILERPVPLNAGVNSLRVRLTSKPGSYLTLGGCGTNGDTVAPTISLVAPPSGSYTNLTAPLVIARYQDALSGVDTTSFSARIDGVDRTSLFTTRSDEASATAPTLTEGVHTVAASVNDVAGNSATTSTTFTVDVTSPSLSFQAPVEGAALPQPTTTLVLNLSDLLSGVEMSTVKILVNGVDRTSLFSFGAGAATAALSASVIQNGANQIVATARDRASNESSTALSFTVDTTAPTLAIGQPVAGARLGSSTTPIVVQFSDDQSLDLSTFTSTLDGAPIAMSVAADSATATATLDEGAHTLAVSIADRAGNTTTHQVSFIVDTQVPSIVITQPAPSFLLPTATPFVAVTYTDAQGVDTSTLRIVVDGVDRTSLFALGPEGATATLPALPEGGHTISAEIRDLTSNLGVTTSSFMTDTLAPSVTIANPSSGARVGTPVPEMRFAYQDGSGSGVDPGSIRAFLDGVEITASFALGGANAVGVPPTPLADGMHTLRVEAGDRAYNVGSAEVTFLVDTLAPVATFETPSDNSFTNDDTPEVRVSFADVGRVESGVSAPPSGVDLLSVRLFLRSGAPDAPEVELTNGFVVGASTLTGVIPGPLPAGTHRLRVSLLDLAGNAFETHAAFEVDVTQPTFQLVSIAPGAGVPTATPSFEIRYTDERSGVVPSLFVLRVDGVDRTTRLLVAADKATGTLLNEDALADGPHTYDVTLFDRAGNRAESGPVSFVVDTVAPTATLAEPLPNAFIDANTTLVRFAFADAAPSAGIDPGSTRVHVDGVDRTAEFTITPDGALLAAAVPALADGVHTVRADIVDFAGNAGSVTAQFTVDTGAPVLTSDIPEEGRLVGGAAIVEGRATVTGTATDLDPALTLTCSSPVGTGLATFSNGTYSCSVPVAEGANQITVSATDSTGHAASITRTLTVDRIAPAIQIGDPTEGTFTSAQSLTVTGTVTDASSAAGLTVSVNGQAAAVTSGTAGGPATFEAANVSVGAGPTAAFEVVATDAAGNVAAATVTVRVDRNAPVVAITQPAGGEYLRGGVTTVTVDVTDETNTILDINGVPGTQTSCVALSAPTKRCTFTADVPLIAGNTTIVATAFDEAGNIGVNQVSAIVDNTPPAISVTSPGPGLITNATSVSVVGTVTDGSPVTLTINGQAVAVAPGGSFSTTISTDVLGAPLSGLEGAREIVFVATDAAGNETTTSVSVFFDRTPPALTVASPLQGAILPSSSVAVSGTVADATAVTITVQGTPATVTGQAWSTSLASLIEGSLAITVRAVDAAGNESTVVREVEVDLGPPTVAITSPASGTLTREATALLAFSVLDRSSTSISLNGVTLTPACPGAIACERTRTVDLADGDNTFTIEATDAGERTASAQVTITRDSVAPIVELVAPESASRGRAAAASVSAVDNLAMASVEVRLAGALGSTVLCSGAASCSGPIVIPEEARPGDSLTLTATATDTAGNITTTSRIVRVTSDGVVTGTVLNDLTSLPLAGATVTLLGPNTRATTTNEQGRYNIPVADISAILRIEKAGMTSVDRVVSVISGSGTVPVDARLTPLAETTSHSPVIPTTNPPAVIPSASSSEVVGKPGPVSMAAEGAQRVTLLSSQGLPNLLPTGFSPLTAFNWIPDNTSAAAHVTVALPTGTATLSETVLVRYDTAMRDWRVVASGLTATDGLVGVDLVGPGSYALVIPDTVTPPMAIPAMGEALAGIAVATIPATATSEGRVDPPVLPPTGGTATGLLRIDSPTPLPSGTIVQADLEETYTLSSGEEASAPKRSIDVVAYKHTTLATAWGTGDDAGTISGATTSTTCAPSTPPTTGGGAVEHLCAAFPITPSRTYSNASLREGRVKLDLLAGRENARGVVGGSEAVSLTTGNVQLNVAAGSLDEDTAIALWSYDDYSPFIPSTNGITPLGEVTVDFASSTLNTSAVLTFRNVAAAPGDTLVVARVDRAAYDGFPRLQVVALADVITANNETNAITRVETGLPGVTLEGIRKEGRYTLLRLAGPIGFITGSTTASGSPVRALITTNSLPFVATSNSSGVYAIPAVPGPVALTARVLGQSLVGGVQTTAVDGTPVTANILLEGAVSQATITPASGAIGVEVNELLTLTSPVALDPTTVNATNITLRTVPTPPAAGSTTVPLRLVLSGSGKQLSIIPTGPITTPPTPALAFSTTYALEITGLLDTVGGLVTAPTTTFRTKDDVKPVYNLKALTFSFPDADGLVTVSAPAGTFPPGTEVLIINSGNGVVLGLTAGNDGEVNGTLPASTLDTLIISVTDPFGNSVIYRQSQFENPTTGETAIGPGGGSIDGPGGTGLEIPEGALNDGGGEWKVKLTLVPESEYPTLYPRDVLTKLLGTDLHAGHTLRMESNREAKFSREVDVRFPLPDFTRVPVDQRPPTPQDAFYTVHRKRLVCPDGSTGCAEEDKIIVFEVIDEAKVQCKAVPSAAGPNEVPATCEPEDLEVVTASPPFAGLVATAFTTILFLAWAYDAVNPARPSRGLVRGTVRRQAYQNGTLASVLMEGVTVSGVSPDEIDPITGERKPLTYIDGGTSATTTSTGTYALWDSRYTGGPIEVVAISGETTVRGQGFEVLPGAPRFQRYQHEAVVNLTFPTEAPPPPVPDILVKLVRADNNAVDLRGIAAVGVPLQVGIKSSIPGQQVTINGVEINGVNYSTRSDLTGRYDYILDAPFSPSTPGTYRLTGTALRPIGDPVAFGDTFRIVAAGGGVDTDNANPPRVIEAQTTPRKNAKGVAVSSFVSLSFTEPVRNVLPNLELTSPEGPVEFRVSAVKPDGTVISDLSTAPTAAVTSITIEPLYGLKFGTEYTVRALSGIQDLDQDATSQPAPKSLTPYETSFETFGPETINPESQDAYSTGGFVVLKTEESTTGWALKHQFGGSTWNGALLGYDASDPTNLTLLSSTFVQNRVIDITGEGTTVVVASGTNHRSRPGALLVYDVTNPQAPAWVGAGTLSSGASDGTPSRIKMKGEKVYAATWRKGIQVVDIGQLRSGFAQCCSTAYFNIVRDLSQDGASFNSGAVISTIDVIDPVSPTVKPWLRDISVIDVEGETIIAVAAAVGLVLANEGQTNVFYRAQPSFGGRTLAYAYAVETALIDGRSVVLVAGIDGAGQNILIVMDISAPGNPIPIGSMTLATQGKAIAGVDIAGDKAYIGFDSPGAPQIEIVQIGDPRFPTSAGVVPGVGGRLQIIDGILYGASYGYATEGVIGGIRTAALDLTPIISGGGVFGVSRAALSLEEAKVRLSVVPRATEITKAEIKLYENGAERRTIDLSTSALEYTFPTGSEFNANSRYAAKLVINGGTPEERVSTARTLRPARFDFLDTQEAPLPDQDPVDVIPVFQGVPTISLSFKNFLPLGGLGRESTVYVEGTVSSAIAPIERVVVNERIVNVTQTGTGVENRGPYTGTYQANVTVGPQTELVTAYAVDASNRISTQSLMIEPTAVFGLIVSRTATPTVPLMPGSPIPTSFRVELIDKGNTAPTQSVELSTGAEPRSLKLTKQGEVYRSEPLIAVPENARFAASLPPAIRDKRVAVRLGSFTQVKLGTVTGRAIPLGLAFKNPQVADFLDPGWASGYEVEVGAPGTTGGTLSLSAHSLRGDLSSLESAASYELARQSADPKSPAFNFYKGRMTPLMDGITPTGTRHRVVPLGRLRAEAAGTSLTLPIGTGADQVKWETLEVKPAYVAGFFDILNLFTPGIPSLPRFWNVTQSATFYRGTTALPGLSVGGFLDRRTFEVDDDSGVTAVVRSNDAWEDASFPQTTDSEGKVRFRVRSMAVEEGSNQPLSGVVLSLNDEVGIRAMTLLGTGGVIPQVVIADVTQKEGDAPKTTSIVGGYASAGGVPRRHSDWYKRVAEVLEARVIGDDPQMTAIRNLVRGNIEAGFLARQILVSAEQLDEYTRWFLIGAMAGVPRGAVGAFKDSVVGVFELAGSAGSLATMLAPSSQEEMLIRLIVTSAIGPAGIPVAKVLANPQFIAQQRLKLKKLGDALWEGAKFLSRPEVQEQLTVSILGSVISNYEGEIGTLATKYLGMSEGSSGYRPLVFGYAIGAMAGYLAELGVELVGFTLVGEGVGAALPVMMKAVSKGGVAGNNAAAVLRSVARLANAGGEGGRLAKGFSMLIKFLDALGPNALGKWFAKIAAVEEGPERVLKLMIRLTDESDGAQRAANLAKGLSEDAVRGLSAAENPVEALVTIQKVAEDANYRGTQRLILVSAEMSEDYSRAMGALTDILKADPALAGGFENVLRDVDRLDDLMSLLGRIGREDPDKMKRAIRGMAKVSECL